MKSAREFIKKRGHQYGKQFSSWDTIHFMEEFAKETLTDYTDFLLKNGYCDSDVNDEVPTAIDQFIMLEK